jgi:hypothetical protein
MAGVFNHGLPALLIMLALLLVGKNIDYVWSVLRLCLLHGGNQKINQGQFLQHPHHSKNLTYCIILKQRMISIWNIYKYMILFKKFSD